MTTRRTRGDRAPISHRSCDHAATRAERERCRQTIYALRAVYATEIEIEATMTKSTEPKIITADGHTVGPGDRVFDYYDGHWGTIGDYVSDSGWFDHHRENGGRGYLDGSRVCVRIPRGNPFYESHGSGNPPA